MGIISSVKNRFPFSLGCTSYIIPADIVPNVRELAPVVDDIELVLFESPDISNIPSYNDISILHELSRQNRTSYTVHLPIDSKAGSSDKGERDKYYDAACRIIERCRPLLPASWIMHLEGISAEASQEDKISWTQWCSESLNMVLKEIPDSSKMAIENLGYPWYWHSRITTQYCTSLCCDVGHLWLYFENKWRDYLISMLPKTSVIHLHGVNGTKDHLSLAKGNRGHIWEFLEILLKEKYNGIVTLEIFNENDLRESAEVITQLWEELR